MMTVNDFKYLVGKTLDAAIPELLPRYFIFVADEDIQITNFSKYKLKN